MSTVEVKVPDIGDFKEVEVIELMVKVGDTVKVDQSLITVESDKASMEIPSSHAGVVQEIKVALGGKVKEGSVVLLLEAAGSSLDRLVMRVARSRGRPRCGTVARLAGADAQPCAEVVDGIVWSSNRSIDDLLDLPVLYEILHFRTTTFVLYDPLASQ